MAMTASRNGTGQLAQRRERVEGVVEAVNEHGIRIAGAWFNWSSYPGKCKEDLWTDSDDVPVRASVALDVTGGKWIAALQLIAWPSEAASTPERTARKYTDEQLIAGTDLGPARPRPTTAATGALATSRDLLIIRQTCVKAAAQLLAGQECGAQDVIDVASALAQWIALGDEDPFA